MSIGDGIALAAVILGWVAAAIFIPEAREYTPLFLTVLAFLVLGRIMT